MSDESVICTDSMDELRQSAVMIRTWIPEVFPANERGQVHFVRCVCESVAAVIDRVIADTKAFHDTAQETAECYHKAHQRAALLQEAIRAIYRAQVYEGGKKENGISFMMINAIMHATNMAGFPGDKTFDAAAAPYGEKEG